MKIAAALAIAIYLQAAPSSSVPTPIGVWRTPVEDGLIRIEPCGDAICGHVAGSVHPNSKSPQTDIRNPDPALRARPLMGLLMMRLVPKGPGHWGDGWIYDPRDGGTYKASLEIVSEGQLRLTGCIAPLLCQTQTWTKTS